MDDLVNYDEAMDIVNNGGSVTIADCTKYVYVMLGNSITKFNSLGNMFFNATMPKDVMYKIVNNKR